MSAKSSPGAVYLDSSAIVKLIVREAETEALVSFLAPLPVRVTSALARVEVVRAVRHQVGAGVRAGIVLSRLSQLVLDDHLLDSAAAINTAALRSLDAIHIASAQALEDELEVFVSYDTRMLAAARAMGVPTADPR